MIEYNFPIILNQKEIGMFQLQEITKITYSVHMKLNEEYQNKGLAIQCLDQLLEFSRMNKIEKLIATVPLMNEPMIKVISKTPFKVCGAIHDGIIWNNQKQDLIIYELEVN